MKGIFGIAVKPLTFYCQALKVMFDYASNFIHSIKSVYLTFHNEICSKSYTLVLLMLF